MNDPAKCSMCGTGERYRDSPLCVPCRYAAIDRKSCKWCGVNPRGARSGYCDTCKKRAAEVLIMRPAAPEAGRPAYRGPEARERTRDTKFGRD